MLKFTNCKKIISYLSLFFLLVECKISKNNDYSYLILLGIIPDLGSYWSKIYQVDPLIIYDPDSIHFIEVANKNLINKNKKKVLLISGWNYRDKSNQNYPSIENLKKRVIENWKHLFTTSEFISMINCCEVYIFDYLTSDPVDKNGLRLRNWLDSLFLDEDHKIIIYAHSMGGLISRFAIYFYDRPDYVEKVITVGTPFHGSPWASPQYQKDKSILGELANFLTNTEGGQDLQWDNYDFSLSGASNLKLLEINSKTDRDDLFITLYGEVPNGTGYESDSLRSYGIFCTLLNDFQQHDCIVPARSAYLDRNPIFLRHKIGNYDHSDINWATPNTRNFLLNLILGL